MKKKAYPFIALVCMVVIIGLAGNEEYADQYIRSNVNSQALEEIYNKLGRYASAVSVKREYLTHKDYYDAKEYLYEE